MSACKNFFQSFGRDAIEMARADRDAEAQNAARRKQEWWEQFYADACNYAGGRPGEDPNDYRLCASCETPFLMIDGDCEWLCYEPEIDECIVWCAREGCPRPPNLSKCPRCDFAVCDNHRTVCALCGLDVCHTCLPLPCPHDA